MPPAVDTAYAHAPRTVPLLDHAYGPDVHLVHDALLLRELAALCRPQTTLPTSIDLLRRMYTALLRYVVLRHWPREVQQVATRMAASHPEQGVWHGEVVAPVPSCVVVDIARAGTVPAQTCFESLLQWFGPRAARQDHLSLSRVVDAHGVAHVEAQTSKIGGSAQASVLLLPDPMGATGTSMARAIAAYDALPPGPYATALALHLIVTPEYLAYVRRHAPRLVVWALRLDRGLSDANVLAQKAGALWSAERGLNEHAYIVPGAGGVGELLNNADH